MAVRGSGRASASAWVCAQVGGQPGAQANVHAPECRAGGHVGGQARVQTIVCLGVSERGGGRGGVCVGVALRARYGSAKRRIRDEEEVN